MLFGAVIILSGLSSAAINDSLHINVQVTNDAGAIQTGTFTFGFNISTSSTCTPSLYGTSSSITTDSAGRISTYLNNITLNFTDQYYLCYYRDGTLKNVSLMGKVPYSFNSDNSENWAGKAISFVKRIASGNKNQNSLLSRHLGLDFNSGVTQSATLTGGAALPHSITYINDKIFIGTIQAPAQFIRMNDLNDLTNQTTFTFDSDGDHDYASAMVYVPEVNRIFVIFGNGNVPSTDRLVVAAVNPDTMTWEDVIINTGTAPGSTTGPSIESDGTYLYTLSATGNSTVNKYLLSNYTLQTQKNITGFGNGHAMQYDFDTAGRLYLTGVNSWVVKMNTSDLSYTNVSIPTIQAFTDDFTMAGDWIYLGAEFSENVIVKMNKNNLSNYERIYISAAANIWSLYFDGTWVWVATSASPQGTIIRVDPATSEIAYYDLGNGDTPNEIVTDGQRLFMTTFTTPGKIFRLSNLNMEGQLRARAGVVYNFVDRSSSAEMGLRDYMILVRNVTGGHMVSLFDTAYLAPGREIVVQDATGTAGAGGNITIQGFDINGDGSAYQQVNGQDNINITTPYGVVTLMTNGTAWFARRG